MSTCITDRHKRQIMLDNYLANCINLLQAVKSQTNARYEDKLKAIDGAQKFLPEVRRLLMYMENTKNVDNAGA